MKTSIRNWMLSETNTPIPEANVTRTARTTIHLDPKPIALKPIERPAINQKRHSMSCLSDLDESGPVRYPIAPIERATKANMNNAGMSQVLVIFEIARISPSTTPIIDECMNFPCWQVKIKATDIQIRSVKTGIPIR